MTEIDIVPHLFRSEYSKLVPVLTKWFGIENIEIAEDIASETFLLALETWPYKGVPVNPSAWLYAVAKNKTRNYLKRQSIFNKKISENLSFKRDSDEINLDFSIQNISDSQLQMLFTLCHPGISTEAQICLSLRILCGLGLNEIADAFLCSKETIHKRLQRAKEKLVLEKLEIEMPDSYKINERLDTVLHTIYLLFSEGYYSESNTAIIRKELCIEALNLTYLLLGNSITNNHPANSLMALMCFHTSRLEARQSEVGNIVLYDDQDRNLWDTSFIEKGFYYLQQASKWEITSTYYMEASIAYWHTVDSSNPDKWTSILKLYDGLHSFNNSPIVALNRTWAFSKVHGVRKAIAEVEKLKLVTNHFYFLLLAELYRQADGNKAVEHFKMAFTLSKTDKEKELIQKKISELESMLKLYSIGLTLWLIC